MNTLEITFIVIGIIIIIVSCLLVDKSSNQTKQLVLPPFSYEESLSSDDKKKLEQKMQELLSDLSEEIVIRTDDDLSRVSNEKIMAINEFSDQILEKIKRNHDEVVFLYNMLNDKEKELKEVVHEIDSAKKKVQEIMEAKSNSDKSSSTKANKPRTSERADTPVSRIEKTTDSVSQTDTMMEIPTIEGLSTNNNTQILELYTHGKSVMEISKLLGLGQGEVKLVIDLFKGKK